MAGDRRGRAGRPFERLKAQVRAEEPYCAKCGQPIDDSLKWPHPYSRSLDHRIPIALGGDPLDRDNAQAAHLTHNVREGSRIRSIARHVNRIPKAIKHMPSTDIAPSTSDDRF